MRTLTKRERQVLEGRAQSKTIPHRDVQRAKIILKHADGISKSEISRQLELHRNQVIQWIKRFEAEGIKGLNDLQRPGRPESYTSRQIDQVIKKVCQKPPKGRSRWTVRSLARAVNMDKNKVNRILQENELYPHRLGTFAFSPDPQFEEKLLEVVGLYMKPPKNAIVLCVDEKTGIQALDRTQPLLPLRAKKPRAWTNEYVRHGTRTLLAALEIQTGKVTAWVNKTRKQVDFITFLNKVVKAYPNERLCVILDNLNTHKGKGIQGWLSDHPNVSFHFTPTHASWVNLIECFFSILTRQGLQQSVHRSTKDLEKFLYTYIDEYNKQCGPFIWTKGPKKLEKIIQLTQVFQEQNVQS